MSEMTEGKLFEDKLENCFIKNREGDDLLFSMKNDEVHASLDGYAIVPMEDYEALNRAAGVFEKTLGKTLENSDLSGARKNVKDIKVVGNGDSFQLLCKAYSKAEGWMKSTKAMEIPGVGCIVQVTTQQGDNVAEALVNVPHVKIVDDPDHEGGRKLTPIV